MIVYVDNRVVTRNDEAEIAQLKGSLVKEFEIKELGSLKYFLRIEISRSKQGIFLSQRKYVLDLKESRMIGCRPCTTPIKANHGLRENDNERLIDVSRY